MSRVLTIALTSIALVTITTASADARGGRGGGRSLFGSSKTVSVPASRSVASPSTTRSVLVPGIRPAARDDGRTAAALPIGGAGSNPASADATVAPRPIKASVEPCAASKLFGSGAGFCQIN